MSYSCWGIPPFETEADAYRTDAISVEVAARYCSLQAYSSRNLEEDYPWWELPKVVLAVRDSEGVLHHVNVEIIQGFINVNVSKVRFEKS